MAFQSLDLDKPNSISNCLSMPESLLKANRDELNIKLNITNSGEQEISQELQDHVLIVAPIGTFESEGLTFPNGDSLMSEHSMLDHLDVSQPGGVSLKTRKVDVVCQSLRDCRKTIDETLAS